MQRFRELAASLPLDEASYLSTHPDPVLLIEPYDQESVLPVDTPGGELSEEAAASTDVLSAQASRGLWLGGASALVHAEARVAWLRKSERNPFVGLVTAGRARNNDLILPHPSISKLHAIFSRDLSGHWQVEDRRSTNGTFLDGLRLPAEQRRPLQDGASLRLGEGVVARYFLPESFFAFVQLVRGGA